MKGLVFTEFLEMVENTFSPDVADRLIDESDLPSQGPYTAVGTYDHHELVAMVSKLSDISGAPVPELVKAFGMYLFPRFHESYPHFFEGINSSLDFLEKIETVIHSEVQKLYPDAELPQFDIQRLNADTLVMTYHSSRHFEDLAEGLITGCIKHYADNVSIDRTPVNNGEAVQFTMSREK